MQINLFLYWIWLIYTVIIPCTANDYKELRNLGLTATLKNSSTKYLYIPTRRYINQKGLLDFHEFSDLMFSEKEVKKAEKIKKWIQYLNQNKLTSFIEKNSNELVVFIHGFGSNFAFSLPASIASSLKNIPSLSYDLLESGGTKVIEPKKKYKLEQYCDQLWELLEYIGWSKKTEFQNEKEIQFNKPVKKLFLVGVSLGATIAATCSAIKPERVIATFLATPIENNGEVNLNNFAHTRNIISSFKTQNEEKFEKMSQNFLKKQSKKVIKNSNSLIYSENVFFQLSNTDVHTFFFWGHDDPFVPLSQNINTIKKYFPNSKITIYCDDDHVRYFNDAIFFFDLINTIYKFTSKKEMKINSIQGSSEIFGCENFPIYTKITNYYNKFLDN